MHTFPFENYSIGYEVTGGWGNTEVISLTLSNTGTEVIENWMLYSDPHGEIQYVNDARLMTAPDGTKYIKNAEYNANVTPGSAVTFEYAVDNCSEIPGKYWLCQTRMETEGDYEVSLKVNRTWGESEKDFEGEIIIRNHTDEPIEAWELTLDTNFTVTEITNSRVADVKELKPCNYLLKGTYTGIIPANSEISLGFIGVKNGEPGISGYSLTSVVFDEALMDFINHPDEIFIYACGSYNSADNAIDIEWDTDYAAQVFGIWQSEDNENYTVVAEVSGSDSYRYAITEDFEKKYFKVSLTAEYGQKAESLPFVVTKAGNGYSVDALDSDADGLSDIYESLTGTDCYDPDTDDDGLPDGFEYDYLDTDLNLADTDGNGICDYDEDGDQDGLSNGQEQEWSLRPDKPDTDGDGLTDGEEINGCQTDPLNVDTDDGKLTDGEEVKLGLDPTKSSTDGVTPDSQRSFDQETDDSVKDDALTQSESWLKPSVSGNVPGDISKNIRVKMSDDDIFTDNRSVLSDVIYLDTAYTSPVRLNFRYDTPYHGDMDNLYILRYDDDEIHVIPTKADENIGTISGEVNQSGNYFVADLEELLKGLGIDIRDFLRENASNEISGKDASTVKSSDSPPAISGTAMGKTDIAFVLDVTGSMDDNTEIVIGHRDVVYSGTPRNVVVISGRGTNKTNAHNYRTIFNVVNTDDLITYLPLTKWNFTKYGTVKSISVDDNYEDKKKFRNPGWTWEWLTGYDYDNDRGTCRTIRKFGAIAENRESLYVLDSTSDGKVCEDNIFYLNSNRAMKELEKLNKTLTKEKLRKYCHLYVVESWKGYQVEINYSPAYLMQTLANMTTHKYDSLGGPMLGRDVKGKYADAKLSFAMSSGKVISERVHVGGMTRPHEAITYYLIAHNGV